MIKYLQVWRQNCKILSEISPQFKFSDEDGIYICVNEESQLSNCASVLVVVQKISIEL
jgi:hypothetical protein